MQDGETFYAVERDGEPRRATGDLFSGLSTGAAVRGGLAAVKVLAPVQPSKLVCVGLNYKDHAGEVGKALPPEPLLFLKPPSAVIGPGDPIRLPPGAGRIEHEAELGLVIGKRAHRVKAANAWDHIFGLICVNDVTAREMQRKEPQYTRCKGSTPSRQSARVSRPDSAASRARSKAGSTVSGGNRRAPGC